VEDHRDGGGLDRFDEQSGSVTSSPRGLGDVNAVRAVPVGDRSDVPAVSHQLFGRAAGTGEVGGVVVAQNAVPDAPRPLRLVVRVEAAVWSAGPAKQPGAFRGEALGDGWCPAVEAQRRTPPSTSR